MEIGVVHDVTVEDLRTFLVLEADGVEAGRAPALRNVDERPMKLLFNVGVAKALARERNVRDDLDIGGAAQTHRVARLGLQTGGVAEAGYLEPLAHSKPKGLLRGRPW